MATGFFQSGYAWRSGSRMHHIDAVKVGREIEQIGSETISRDDIIKVGIGGTGELAKCFTQDRDEAARKRWDDEADYVMRSLIPVVVNPRTEEESSVNQRVWLPVYTETQRDNDSGMYRRVPLTIDTLPADGKSDKHMRGWIELTKWRDKYGNDPLYAPVIAAIDALDI
jgi:hypothetical protein